VIFDTPVWQITPTENTIIFGESVTFNIIRHSDYTVNIYGDFISRTAGSIQSELVVNGNFYAFNGVTTSQVNIVVKQNLRHQVKNEDGTYSASTGALSMNPGTRVTVYGDFYTQTSVGLFANRATMELHGNLTQVGTDTRFVPQDLFNLVFAGSEQRVSFDRHDSNAILRGVSGANGARRVYLDTPIHAVWLAEDAIFYGDSSVTFMHPNWNTVKFMGSLENLREIQNGDAYIDGDFESVHSTLIGNASTVIVNGSMYLHNGLSLGNPTSRLSVRGNLYNGVGVSRVSNVRVNGGGLLDLRGDYIQPDSNEGVIESNLLSRIQLSGNSEQRIVFPAGRRVHLHNLHIRNAPSRYTISNGLNTYSFADAIANQPNSPRIWTNLFFDIEEVTIPNIPLPDDEDDEIELPDNTGMLAWPANSGEVTMWFGIVDHLFDEVHNGIDIQDEIGAPVYSISNGIVTDVYYDPFYGNVVVVDFLYYGEFRRAKYCHLETVDIIIGEKVSKGQTIGSMGTDTRVNKGLLELRLYKDGGIAIDPFPVMERPDVDLSFLLYPMAFSFSFLTDGMMGRMGLMSNNQHGQYMGNNYLEEGEVYLWEWAMEFIVSQGGYVTRDQLHENGILSWCEITKTATFSYGDIRINVGTDLQLAENIDNGTNSRLAGRVTETWRVAVVKDWLWAVSATEITYGQIVNGSLRNNRSNEWYKIRRGNNNGLRVHSYVNSIIGGVIFSTLPIRSTPSVHTFPMDSYESSFRDEQASNQWYYIRLRATDIQGALHYSFAIFPPYLTADTIRFSAFSLGSNLFNICTEQIRDYSRFSLMGAYDDAVNFRRNKPVNPAEHFVFEMNAFFRLNQLNVLGLNYNFANSNFLYYDSFLNKDNVMIYPNKAQVIAAMQTSDIVYIATHGSTEYGLWIDRVQTSVNPRLQPALNDNEAAEFESTRRRELIQPATDFRDLNTNRLKWLILSACSQLDNGGWSTDWSNALLRNNSAHGILGYYGQGPGHIRQNETTERFFQNLYDGTYFVDSWRLANVRDRDEGITSRNWAALVNGANRNDSMLNLLTSTSPTNPGHERTIWLYLRNRYDPSRGYRRIQMTSPSRNANAELPEYGIETAGIMAYYQSNAREGTRLEFDIVSEYEFSINRIDYSLKESQKFNQSKHEIIDLAIDYIIELSPIRDLYIADIGFVTRREMGPDGAESNIEILECEITVIPMINDLPVYSRDMYLHIIFDNEEIIKVECNLPEDLESFIESRENIDNFSEDVLQSEVLTTFDYNEVSRAYYFTETNELIPVYVADCESYERVRIFRADTGEEIQF